MADMVAGLMSTPKYAKNIMRMGDIKQNAPYTVISTDAGGLTVILPLPVNLSSNMGADWQQEGVGIMKYQTLHNKDVSDDILSSSSYTEVLKILDKKGGETIRSTNKDVKAIIARSRDSKSTLGGLKFSGNPRNEMIFNGMPFKSYSFTFNLIPYKKQDSADIQSTIRAIQKASAPAMRGAKMFMEYPNTWFVKFKAGDNEGGGNEYLMKLNECCCTAINVNYTPHNDSSNMHEENAPISVELGLEFTEIFIPTKETIDKGYNG